MAGAGSKERRFMNDEEKYSIIESLLNIIKTPLVVCDIGCRWGFQEHWKRLESVVQLIGFDADDQEIQVLNSSTEKEQFVPKVLGANSGHGYLFITQNPACSSLYPPDENLVRSRPGTNDTSLVSKRAVEISTLDNWVVEKGISKIDFIKLDVQGAELDVLKGAEKILKSIRALEVEVQFNPLYQGVPLFGDVDQFLRKRGFSLWRIKNFSHYKLAGIDIQSTTQEIINYDIFPVSFTGKSGQLFWADAFYVHNEIAHEALRSWETTLKDACITSVLGFDDLYISSLQKLLETCPEEVAQEVRKFFIPENLIPSLGEGDETPALANGSEEKESDLDDMRSKLQQLESELSIVRAERDQAIYQMNALYQSNSYRITAPLRFAVDLVRKLLRKT